MTRRRKGQAFRPRWSLCLNYCLDKGYKVTQRFSEAFSGLTLDRPKLQKLRNTIRANDVDVVVVYCLDRLSRNATHGVILRDELDKHNVLLESVTEDIDKSPLGEAITYLRGTFAQIEAEKIKERTMRGKQARLKEGKLPQGTGIGIYGYEWDKSTGRRRIIDQEAEVIRRIFNMSILGTSTNKIALSLNQEGIQTKSGSLWHPLTVRRILNNLTYTGKTYFGQTKRVDGRIEAQPKENWTLLPDVTPQIITEDTFVKAQEAMKDARDSRPVKPNAAYLLTGFIRCPKCGSRISGMTMNGKYRYYQCQGSRPTATRGKICDAGYIKADELETEVWRKVIVMMTSPQTVLKTLTDKNQQQPDNITSLLNKQIEQLRKKLKTYSTKEKKLYDLMSHEAVTVDYVLESVEKLRQERINDEQQLKSLIEQRKEVSWSQNLTLQLSDFAMNKMADLFMEHEYRTFDIINHEDDAPELIPVSISERLANRRLLLESIKLRVLADHKSFSFNFTLQGNLISSTQEEEFASFDKELRKFEEENAYVTLGDLIDLKKPLAEGTPLAHKVNEFNNNLVTIEQSSG